jgi:hypothetical protein
LKNHAIGTFDLDVALRVGDLRVVDINHDVLQKSQKADPVKADLRLVMILLGTPKR